MRTSELGPTRVARRRRSRRTSRRRTASIVGAVVLLLVADAAWAAWSTRDALRSAQNAFTCGADALMNGAMDEAAGCIQRARDEAASATTFGLHPSVVLARFLPWIGDDVDAIDSLARASAWAASGGTSLTEAARAAGWSRAGVAVLGADGVIDLELIERAVPGLEAAADNLERASAEMAGIATEGLVQPLERLVLDARRTLRQRTDVVVRASELSGVLPAMLGADGPKRYLLAFQNLSAPRGTGGYLGFLGELEAADGQLRLATLDPVGDVELVPPVDVPTDVARRYGRFGVATTMWAANYPPDVADSSRIAKRIFESAGGSSVDGVVWTDTIWMADMLASIGPVRSTAWPEPVTANTIVDIFNRGLFEGTDTAESDEAQARLGLDLWRAVLTRRPDPRALANAMSEGTRTGHFAVFSTDGSAQTALEWVGAAGQFELAPNPLAVVWQDASASRAGYFAEHEVEQSIELSPEGEATGRTRVTMRNGAPNGPPSILLGDAEGSPVGWWGVDVEVYLPLYAEGVQIETSEPSVVGVDEAYGHPVADAFLYADAGGTCTANVTFRRTGAATEQEGIWTYSTVVRPQPMLRPVPFALDVTLPEGAEVISAPDDAVVEGSTVRWSGTPSSSVELVIRYSLPA